MLLTLDFETAYGIHPITKENITLSKMTTEEYIRHPLFKAHMVGLKFGDAPAYYVYGDGEIRAALGAIDWANTSCLVHHGQFDGAILNWIYGHRPAFWLDTLAMANALFPWASSSLANLCKLLNLEDKGKELVQSKDKWELPPEIIATLGGYCCKDVELTYQAFFAMKEHFPMMELRLIDLTTRMFSEPVWEADRGLLLGEYRNELRTKRQFMRQAQAEQADLMSNDKFALLLESLGVEPPTKISTKTGKVAYAFAKSDEEFKVLLDHPDPRVQALVEARISVKSTIKQTRTKRLYKISKRGRVPVYLRYYGAHSGRWSGGDSMNLQNLPRYDPRNPTSGALRRAVVAPEGQVNVVVDLSQIEARMLAYVAGQEDLLEVFRTGGDPYCHMASTIFGREITKKDKAERQVGKATILGCGYSMSWRKFQDSLRVGFLGMPSMVFDKAFADMLGADVKKILKAPVHRGRNAKTVYEEAMTLRPPYVPESVHLIHCACTKFIVDRYRESNDKIVEFWDECDRALGSMVRGMPVHIGVGVSLLCEGESIWYPTGMRLQYHNLRVEKDGKSYTRRQKGQSVQRENIYGGKIAENLTQGLSRIVIAEQMLEVAKKYKVASSTHDEIICVVPEEQAGEALTEMKRIMRVPPTWAPDLPLDCDGGWHRSYGLCEK